MMCSTTKIPHGQLELAPTVQATGKRVPLDEAMSVTMRKLALKQIKLLEANADGEGAFTRKTKCNQTGRHISSQEI
jgi:rRNA processing protein Krr1/Pno1